MVGNKLQGAEIRLNPAHLGPMEVRVQIQNDQASISFTAQHGLVREALEAAIPRLREMLGESGLQLNNVTVSDQSLAEQRRQEAQSSFAGRSAAGTGEEMAQEEALLLAVTPLREGAGTIDYFA
jgi:flagellar hook-length control protein FliK